MAIDCDDYGKVSAQQRAGRAGRTHAGQCFRLYSSDCLSGMMEETVPEILRSNVANAVLSLKQLNVVDVLAFDFLDRPSQEQLEEALLLLRMLGAIDSSGVVTDTGARRKEGIKWARLRASLELSCFRKTLTERIYV